MFGLLAFGYGLAVGRYRLPPAAFVNDAVGLIRSYVRFGEFVPSNRRVESPLGAPRSRVTLHDPTRAMGQGFYAALGWDDAIDRYVVWLLEVDGRIVHIWPVDETHFAELPRDTSSGPQAMLPLRDGSILVNFDQKGLAARLDACGQALWIREGFYHHSFEVASAGGIWTWEGVATPFSQFQYVVRFDIETGEPLSRIGLLEDIIGEDPDLHTLFSVPPGFRFELDDPNPGDWFHTNDVEELPAQLAAAFPMFVAGDLLLSIRNLDMIAVIDQTGRLKWSHQGPWREGHDPDFRPDGTIAVFNNNVDRDTSSVLVLDPAMGRISNATANFPFFTKRRGKQQTLPNGNLLITIPEEGRAVELTPTGERVFEINNVSAFSEAFNEDLVNVKWLPPGFFETFPDCPG